MEPRDPWKAIRSLRQAWAAWMVCAIAGILAINIWAPARQEQEWLIALGFATTTLGAFLAVRRPPCPACGHPFLFWSLGNWGTWTRIYSENRNRPFRYLAEFLSPSCPTCELPYGADPSDIETWLKGPEGADRPLGPRP